MPGFLFLSNAFVFCDSVMDLMLSKPQLDYSVRFVMPHYRNRFQKCQHQFSQNGKFLFFLSDPENFGNFFVDFFQKRKIRPKKETQKKRGSADAHENGAKG